MAGFKKKPAGWRITPMEEEGKPIIKISSLKYAVNNFNKKQRGEFLMKFAPN